jgi:hypothetical protein
MESLQGVHHFYLGLLLALIGFLMLWAPKPWVAVVGIAIGLLGIWIMLDDFWQHAMQRFVQPDYDSPLKILFFKYSRQFPLIGNVTKFIDNVFCGHRPL